MASPVIVRRKKKSGSRTKKSKSQRRRQVKSTGRGRIIFFLFALGLAAFLGLFGYIDSQVAKRLAARSAGLMPVVYSDIYRVTPASQVSPGVLRNRLLSRRYREVNDIPDSAGDFNISGSLVQVYTREFTDASGKKIPAKLISYNSATGSIRSSEKNQSSTSLILEPQVVSPLGTGNLRASNFKRLDQIPPVMRNAIIAIEDERFYRHFGLDVWGISRAMARNLAALRIVEGGSTLTQQLAKNLLFTPARTIGRKFLEALAALSIERRLSKNEILELYLNEIYLGQEGPVAIHGVAEAAESFFGKRIEDINLAEAALLAGIIRAPSLYSPRRHLRRAADRRDVVINKMLELGYITTFQAGLATKSRPNIQAEGAHTRSAPHFIAALSSQLDESISLESALLSGLTVFSGLDPDMQTCAEKVLPQTLNRLEEQYPKLKTGRLRPIEAALVAIEPFSGKIRAWVGGRDYSLNQFNHVSQARRQIGSTIKPFLYLTALDASLTPAFLATPLTVLSDRPLEIELPSQPPWEPENFDKQYRGDVTARFALENSLNIPAVRLAQGIGLGNFARTVRNFRLSPQAQPLPSLALGALDTTLLDLTSGYAALANGGRYVEPRLYLVARDSSDEALATAQLNERRVADEAAVFVLTNLLQGVMQRGTGASIRAMGFTDPAAGKTGTSNDARDAWFVGFTPDLVAGVWVGFDDNSKLNLTGGRAAAPIWAEFMKCVAPFHDRLSFVPPAGVAYVTIDSQSGQRATSECPPDSSIREVFVSGTEPRTPCRLHSGAPVIAPSQNEPREEPTKRRRGNWWERLFG